METCLETPHWNEIRKETLHWALNTTCSPGNMRNSLLYPKDKGSKNKSINLDVMESDCNGTWTHNHLVRKGTSTVVPLLTSAKKLDGDTRICVDMQIPNTTIERVHQYPHYMKH